MDLRYQSIYPSAPLLRSSDIVRPRAADLLSLEYFEAEPAVMPTEVFAQHHLLLNLQTEDHRVENWRDGNHRDFTYRLHEICLTPAGVRSGWRWHAPSKVIVVTIEPDRLEIFCRMELGLTLSPRQLRDVPQQHDPELVMAGAQLLEGLRERSTGSEVVYESLARIFLVKLVRGYGELLCEGANKGGLDGKRCKRVLDFIRENYARHLTIEEMANVAALSPRYFSRAFRMTLGEAPYQYLSSYRTERAKQLLAEPGRSLHEVASLCGFADQPHFTRAFKRATGVTPLAWRTR